MLDVRYPMNFTKNPLRMGLPKPVADSERKSARDLVDIMALVMRQEDELWVSAPQVGVDRTIFVVASGVLEPDPGAPPGHFAFINPTVRYTANKVVVTATDTFGFVHTRKWDLDRPIPARDIVLHACAAVGAA